MEMLSLWEEAMFYMAQYGLLRIDGDHVGVDFERLYKRLCWKSIFLLVYLLTSIRLKCKFLVKMTRQKGGFKWQRILSLRLHLQEDLEHQGCHEMGWSVQRSGKKIRVTSGNWEQMYHLFRNQIGLILWKIVRAWKDLAQEICQVRTTIEYS